MTCKTFVMCKYIYNIHCFDVAKKLLAVLIKCIVFGTNLQVRYIE